MNRKKLYFFTSLVLMLGLTFFLFLDSKSSSGNTYNGSENISEYSTINLNSEEVEDDNEELHGVWISYLNFNKNGYTRSKFKKEVQEMFDNCVDSGFNTVFVHVRMFADAMYNSKYFPWSKYCSGTQGKSPGYDPLAIMIKQAHARGLEIHAWINPYRITSSTTDYSSISKSSYAYKWAHSSKASERRNVISYNGSLYFNPAKKDVINLITNGVIEIVENYDIDGIHFDDYFYPNLGSNYKNVFDAKEYNTYKTKAKNNGETPYSIVKWRRSNVDTLIQNVYAAIKDTDVDCMFGISPAGNLNNLYLPNSYYCDVKKWIKSNKYVDYICPQIYWSFTNSVAPYKQMCDSWTELPRNSNVSLYIGLAGYRAGISKQEAKAINDIGWSKSNTILKRQVLYARETNEVNGFIVFDYADIIRKSAMNEITNLQKAFF